MLVTLPQPLPDKQVHCSSLGLRHSKGGVKTKPNQVKGSGKHQESAHGRGEAIMCHFYVHVMAYMYICVRVCDGIHICVGM